MKKHYATIKMTAFSKLKHIMPNLKFQSYGLAFICQKVISYGLSRFEVLYLEIDTDFILYNMSFYRKATYTEILLYYVYAELN